MTLQELIALGCVPQNLVECKKYSAATSSQLGNFSDEEKAKVQAVVLDNSIWVATPDREPPVRANVVYSHDGEVFGFWNRRNHSFSTLELNAGSLVATKIFSLKEENNMAELNIDDAFKEAAESAAPQKMNIGDAPKPAAAKTDAEKQAEKAERERKKQAKEVQLQQQASEIKHLASRSGATYKLDPKYIDNNRHYGRFLGFFTATDPVVKVSLKQTPVNSGTEANPHYTLKPGVTLPTEVEKKFDNGAKNIGAKYLVCKTDVVFKQAGPSSIVAGVVKTPALTEITSIQELDGSRVFNADCADNKSMVMKVLPKEALYAYLELNYDKRIQEDESIPNHTQLFVKSSEVKPKDATKGTATAQKQYRTRIVAEGRSTFVEGNFFPLETYDKVILGSATAEQKTLANNNFAALLKQYNAEPRTNASGEKSAPKGEMSAEALEMFHTVDAESVPAKGLYVCESAIVNKGQAVQCKPYSSKDKDLRMDVTALPVREAVESKDGTTTRYVYRKSAFDAPTSTALTDNAYASFIQRVTAAGEDVDFAAVARKAKKDSAKSRKPATTKTVADRVSGLEMLALRASKEVKVDAAMDIDSIFSTFRDATV